MKRLILLGVVAAALAGCSRPVVTSPPGPTTTATANGSTTTTSAPTTTTTEAPTPTAEQVIQDLVAIISTAHLAVVFNAATDPNHLLGRPNGYLSKASFIDSRVPSSDSSGEATGNVDAGGSVEVFSSATGAKARAAYIQSVLKADPILGTEYDFLNGPVLLRVSQYLTPTQAQEYQQALAKLKV